MPLTAVSLGAGSFAAEVLEEARGACGVMGGADEGSEVNECLVEDERFAMRDQEFRESPDFPVHRSSLRVAADAEGALDQAANVCVHDRGILVEGKTANGSGSVAADSGKRGEFLRVVRQISAALLDDVSCDAVQSRRSEVVAERAPAPLYLFQRSRSELFHCGIRG